jgi:hypothetical protein
MRPRLKCLILDSLQTGSVAVGMERRFWEAPLLGRGLDARTMLGIKMRTRLRESDLNPGSCRPPGCDERRVLLYGCPRALVGG